MQKLEELERWIKDSFRTQAEAAEKIGTTQTTISKWIKCRQGVSPDFQKKLRKMHYHGSFEPVENREGFATREELAELRGSFQTEIRLVRETMEKLAEVVRALTPQEPR